MITIQMIEKTNKPKYNDIQFREEICECGCAKEVYFMDDEIISDQCIICGKGKPKLPLSEFEFEPVEHRKIHCSNCGNTRDTGTRKNGIELCWTCILAQKESGQSQESLFNQPSNYQYD